jgi:hypothetical protein
VRPPPPCHHWLLLPHCRTATTARSMDAAEARALVQRAVDALPAYWSGGGGGGAAAAAAAAAGHGTELVVAEELGVTEIQRLWGGMGAVYALEAWVAVRPGAGGDGATDGGAQQPSRQQHQVVAKRVRLPSGKLEVGDERKKLSYECEARFYEHMAAGLLSVGCRVPRGIWVERGEDGVTILMSQLTGAESWHLDEAATGQAVRFLARSVIFITAHSAQRTAHSAQLWLLLIACIQHLAPAAGCMRTPGGPREPTKLCRPACSRRAHTGTWTRAGMSWSPWHGGAGRGGCGGQPQRWTNG